MNNDNDLADINVVPFGAMLNDPTGDANAYRPRRNLQALKVFTHNHYSNYNSLQSTLTKQSGWANFTLAYTWSKAMGIIQNPANRLNLAANYGPLDFDRTHLLASSYVLNIPDLVKGSGNAFAKGIANGWQISGVLQVSSGVNIPRNVNENFNMAVPIPGEARNMGPADVNGTPAVLLMPRFNCDPRANLQSGQYLNGSCFAPPVALGNGRVGINGGNILPYFRGPAFFNTDLSVFKNFRFGESRNIQFRASAYNFPNHPVRSFVDGDQNLFLNFNAQGQANPNFGFANSKVGRRIVQLGLRFLF